MVLPGLFPVPSHASLDLSGFSPVSAGISSVCAHRVTVLCQNCETVAIRGSFGYRVSSMYAPGEHTTMSDTPVSSHFDEGRLHQTENGSLEEEAILPAYVDSDPVEAAAHARSLSEKSAPRKWVERVRGRSGSEASERIHDNGSEDSERTGDSGSGVSEQTHDGGSEASPSSKKKALIKALAFLGVLLLLLVLDRVTGLSSSLMSGSFQEKMVSIQQDHFLLAMVIWCFLVTLCCALLALPVWMFSAAAGALFGAWSGSVVVAVSTTCGAVLAFIAGRYFLQEVARPLAMKNKWLRKWLFEEEANVSTVLIVTRLIPIIPYNIQNLAYGVADISLSRFTLYTFLFMMPSNIGICTVASALAKGFSIPGVCFGFLLIAGSVMAGIGVMKSQMKDEFGVGWIQRKHQ